MRPRYPLPASDRPMTRVSGEPPDQPPGHAPGDSLRVGLIPAPEMPQQLIESILEELPSLFGRYIDDRHEWQVFSETDPLIGAEESTDEMLHQARKMKRYKAWDYAICVTDLPVYRRHRLVIAEASETCRVALLSQPALGASPLRRRIREAILHLLNEMHHGSSEAARRNQQDHNREQRQSRRRHGLRNTDARHLMGRRLSEVIAPIQRISPDESSARISVRFIAQRHVAGHCRLLAGMVRANSPWRIFPAFRKVIAVAFATGTYGLLFPTLWQLSNAYELWRFALLTIASMTAMVAWIVIAHGLWEPQRHHRAFPMATLYNLTTLITLGIGVLFYYIMLLLLFLGTVIIFVPLSLLQSTLGQEVSLWFYPAMAWLAASVATFVGALGSALESDATVREATYGYRQRSRQQRVQKLLEEEESTEGSS